MPSSLLAKSVARQLLKGTRASLPASYVASASVVIADRIHNLPEVASAAEVHCFWPRAGAVEIDMRQFVIRTIARGGRVYLPVVVNPSCQPGEEPRILEAPLEDASLLREHRWSILEPPADAARRFACSVAVVPGLGVGRNAVRIGQGWGFYDELLAGTDVPIILPCFDACVVDAITSRPADVPVTCVVTESRVLRNHRGKLL
jgi:5,10-methenyltetrahydrofolate synthetase